MPEVSCVVVRWVAEEPQPGIVEAQLTDADGRIWSFVDKASVFSGTPLQACSAYPAAGAIRCEVVRREACADGREIMTVDVGSPDGLGPGGPTSVRVPASAVRT